MSNNNDEMDNNVEEDVYIPEQLDDVDFEAEKKRKRRNSKKNNNTNNEDNELNYKKKRNNKLIILLILFIIIIVVLIIGYKYFIKRKNNNSNTSNEINNIINSFINDFNSHNWDDMMDKIDIKGFYVLNLYLAENQEKAQEKEMEYVGDYSNFSKSYDECDNYENYINFRYNLNTVLKQKDKILEYYLNGYDEIKLEEISNIELVEENEKGVYTNGLYKISAVMTVSGFSQTVTDKCVFYIAKEKDGVKIVSGDLLDLIFGVYANIIYNYQNSSIDNQKEQIGNSDNNQEIISNENISDEDN